MTARARQRSNTLRSPRLGRLQHLAATWLLASVARADLSLKPAADGSVGAWLAASLPRGAGPADFDAPPAANAALGPRLGGARWAVVDGGTGALDVRKAVAGGQGRSVALAAVARARSPFAGWLLLSVDGRVRVAVDGQNAFERAAPHARGAAWDSIPLDFPAGDHTVLLLLENAAPAWSIEARLVARADLEPPEDLEWLLPGTTDVDAFRVTSRLLRVTVSAGLLPWGFQPRVRFEFPRGAPVEPVAVTLRPSAEGATGPPILFTLPRARRGAVDVDVRLPDRVNDGPLTAVQIALEGDVRRLPVTLDPAAPKVVERAFAQRDRLASAAYGERPPDDVLAASLEYDAGALAALGSSAAPGALAARARLESFVQKLEAGKDPSQEPGVLALARRSTLDGLPQRFVLHVPKGYEPAEGRRYPLVVVLHGYGGYPERVMAAFLGTDSALPHPRVEGFVLAPHGHGDAFYRGPGETEVMDLVDWTLSHYPIDPQRVSVTGISMGGTGAAHFAFRYADRFAAAGALAGYHSYFVRRDVRGRELRAWEWAELARHSPASFADNGLGTFLFLAQGTKDLPLLHTTSLAARYKELGYPLRETYPDTGHDVFRVAWAGGSLFPVLARFERDPSPRKVVLKTDSLRLGSRAWVRVTALESSAAPGKIAARVAAADTVAVETDGVAAFELARAAPHLAVDGPLHVEVDGARFTFDEREPVALHRGGQAWEKGPSPPAALAKKPGVEGPVRDAFTAPLTFVYGTLDPRESLVARQVAEHFRARWSGNARFPLVADVTLGAPRGRNYFLVGSKTSNRVVRDLDAKLPFGIEGGVVRLGPHRISGDQELGLCAVFPNPEDPDHVVVVVEATGVRGLVRSMSLPNQLPDFIVFDSALAPAAGEQVLGSARVHAAGHFDRFWGVPQGVSDAPLPPNGPLAAAAKRPVFASERRTLAATEAAPRE